MLFDNTILLKKMLCFRLTNEDRVLYLKILRRINKRVVCYGIQPFFIHRNYKLYGDVGTLLKGVETGCRLLRSF